MSVYFTRLNKGGGDREEWEAAMVPSFGARASWAPASRWLLALDLSGSAPGEIVGLSEEPANVAYWTAEATVSYRVFRHMLLRGGVRYSDMNLHFKGREADQITWGNNNLSVQSIEPTLSMSVTF